MSKPKSPADQAKDAFEKSALPPQRDAHKAPEGTTDDTQLDPPKPEDGNELQVDPKSEIPGTVEHTEGEPGPEPDHTFDPTAPPPQAAQKAAPHCWHCSRCRLRAIYSTPPASKGDAAQCMQSVHSYPGRG